MEHIALSRDDDSSDAAQTVFQDACDEVDDYEEEETFVTPSLVTSRMVEDQEVGSALLSS